MIRLAKKLFLTQKNYHEVLARLSMQDQKPLTTPLAVNFRLSTNLTPQTEDEEKCMYGMVCTRPDISHSVVVIWFMGNWGKTHWQATVKWIFRYLRGTADKGLVYDKHAHAGGLAFGFVDTDYAATMTEGDL